jgi:hypothetical protein
MTSRHGRSKRSACEVCLAAATLGFPLVTVLVGCAPAGASAPTLTVTPSTDLHDGESVSVSIGPNSVFTPNSRVNILECADPGGSVANLPKDDSTCDGNTIQGNTILVAANGSASDPNYTIYLLPSPALGEQSNDQPVCNQTNPCVLYVGQNQNDFTAPKVFSTAFSIAPASGGTTTTGVTASTGTTTTPTTNTSASSSTATTADPASGNSSNTTPPPSATAATSTSSTVSPSVTLASTAATNGTALANTGVPSDLEWVIGFGIALLVGGSLGRRLIGYARR